MYEEIHCNITEKQGRSNVTNVHEIKKASKGRSLMLRNEVKV